MATVMLPDVGEIVEAVRTGVQRKLRKRRKLYTAEDLIEDVGLDPEQFDELLGELEERFSVEFDPESVENLTVTGALIARLMRLCSREIEDEDLDREVA